jgi:hypothetical protein
MFAVYKRFNVINDVSLLRCRSCSKPRARAGSSLPTPLLLIPRTRPRRSGNNGRGGSNLKYARASTFRSDYCLERSSIRPPLLVLVDVSLVEFTPQTLVSFPTVYQGSHRTLGTTVADNVDGRWIGDDGMKLAQV